MNNKDIMESLRIKTIELMKLERKIKELQDELVQLKQNQHRTKRDIEILDAAIVKSTMWDN